MHVLICLKKGFFHEKLLRKAEMLLIPKPATFRQHLGKCWVLFSLLSSSSACFTSFILHLSRPS